MFELGPQDKEHIRQSILAKYEKVAVSPEGQFRYPTGRAGLEGQDYDSALTSRLPEAVLASFAGVGNPFKAGLPQPGQSVLDLGCGAGVDALLAALMIGPEGRAVGLEFSMDMLGKAQENQKLSGIGNASFFQGTAECLDFDKESFDLVISNGVFNLLPDKLKALREVFRVLKKGGRLQLADQFLEGERPKDAAGAVASWFT